MKYLLTLILTLASALSQASPVQNTAFGNTQTLLSAATTTGLGPLAAFVGMLPAVWSLSCTTTGTGTVSATVQVLLSNNVIDVPAAAATLTNSGTAGTSAVTSETSGNVPWKIMQLNQTAISGTSAATTCTLGY